MISRIPLGIVVLAMAVPVLADSPSFQTSLGRESLIPKETDGVWYYEIGGAEYIQMPNIDRQRIRVGAGISWNGNLMCSNLNPDISFDAFMNGAKKGWVNMQRNAVGAVKGTIASTPGLILQNIDPGLYEMVSTGFIQAENLFQIEIADCRRITSDLMKSKPNYDWVSVSGYEGMRDYFNNNSSPKNNINQDMGEMVKDAEEDTGKKGIDWVCGRKAGGDGQAAIKGSDVLVSAYNSMLGRSSCDTSNPGIDVSDPNSHAPAYLAYWSTPQKAKDWFKEVLGETQIYTSPSKKPLAKSTGIGLMPMVQKTKVDVHNKLADIVTQNSPPTLSQLRSVSFSDILLTKDIVTGLKNDPYRDSLISRIALDVALQREMVRALEMRRMLLVGSDLEVVSAKEPSKKMVEGYIARLSSEISMVNEEVIIRKSLSSSTAPYILQRQQERKLDSLETLNSFNQSKLGK